MRRFNKIVFITTILFLTCTSLSSKDENKLSLNNLLFYQNEKYIIDDVFFYIYKQYNQTERFIGIVIPTEGVYFDSEGYFLNSLEMGFCVFLGIYSFDKGEIASGIYKSGNQTLDVDECCMLEISSDAMFFTDGSLHIRYGNNYCYMYFEGVLENNERVIITWYGKPQLFVR